MNLEQKFQLKVGNIMNIRCCTLMLNLSCMMATKVFKECV